MSGAAHPRRARCRWKLSHQGTKIFITYGDPRQNDLTIFSLHSFRAGAGLPDAPAGPTQRHFAVLHSEIPRHAAGC